MRSAAVYLSQQGSKGRGVFAARRFDAGARVLADPVVLVAAGDVREGSTLSDYLIYWDEQFEAIACGLSSFVNHAETPNCRLESDFAAREIRLVAVRDIVADEELTIRYRCPLWFEPLP